MASRISADVRNSIIAHVRAGCTLAEACQFVAISESTVKTWLRRGRQEDGTDYAAFAAAVDQAREAAATADMTQDEFQAHLNTAVRRGSVQAMRLWWSVRTELDKAGDEFSELDELDGMTAGGIDCIAAEHDDRLAELRRRT